jgi:23S rRNA (guanine2445-N2)-methyltransferase / 23S rRNA (guanine2069-N7)-methyltransferase
MAYRHTRENQLTKTNNRQPFFASSVRYVEGLLAEELVGLGAEAVRETRAGVSFQGTLETAYRACLWSRVASRILLPLKTFRAGSPDELYEGAAEIDWSDHLSPDRTLAVDCSLSDSSIRHSGYAAQLIKDAVVDHLRKNYGRRSSVSIQRPDVRLNLHLHRDEAVISVDLSGESLHRRAYRLQTGEAPLKENIAAAVLLRAQWPRISRQGGFIDPFCGSGTLPIEAALMAADCPPGLRRPYFGFLGWKGHDRLLWKELWEEGRERFAAGCRDLPPIVGCDHDPRALRAAGRNIKEASLEGLVRIQLRELDRVTAPGETGLVAANPPYGDRLDADSDLPGLYAGLGRVLKEQFSGWKAAVLTGHSELARSIGLQAFRRYTLYNGTIKCTLVHIDISPENRLLAPGGTAMGPSTPGQSTGAVPPGPIVSSEERE